MSNTPQKRRKIRAHDIERLSVAQFKEALFAEGWEADEIRDYGEDLFVRPFSDGRPHGFAFYAQVKGTEHLDDLTRDVDNLCYPIERANLRQWHSFDIPVALVVWDITTRQGYWVHMQPLIEAHLKDDPEWLIGGNKRTVRVPRSARLSLGNLDELRTWFVQQHEYLRNALASVEQNQASERKDQAHDLEVALRATVAAGRRGEPVSAEVSALQAQLIGELEAKAARESLTWDGWASLADLYYNTNQMEKALRAINRATPAAPRTAAFLNMRASILVEYACAHAAPPSVLQEARRLFEEVRQLQPGAYIEYNLGNCYASQGEHATARRYFESALAANPDPALKALILKNLGTTYFHAGEHDREIEYYRQALDVEPTLLEALDSWGLTELTRGNYEQAVSLFERSRAVQADITKQSKNLLYWLAFAYWKTGRRALAEEATRELLASNPAREDARVLRLLLLSELWREELAFIPLARSAFEERLVDHPEDLGATRELFLLFEASGESSRACALVKSAVLPTTYRVREVFQHARLQKQVGEADKAIELLQRASKQVRHHALFHELAKQLRDSGRLGEAARAYADAIDGEHNIIPLLVEAADCCHLAGDYARALQYGFVGLVFAPNHWSLWNNMAYAAHMMGLDVLATTCAVIAEEDRDPILVENIEKLMETAQALLEDALGQSFMEEIHRLRHNIEAQVKAGPSAAD